MSFSSHPPSGPAQAAAVGDAFPGEGVRRPWLDLLRGGCASWVLLSHVVAWCAVVPATRFEACLQTGLQGLSDGIMFLFWGSGGQHPAVVCFFVLSGFCIHRRYHDAGRSASDWPDFFKSRLWRLLPVYFAASLLGFAAHAVWVRWGTAQPVISELAQGDWRGGLLRLGVLTAMLPHELWLGNGTLWSIPVELFLYLFYPLALLTGRRIGYGKILAFLCAGEAVILLRSPVENLAWLYCSPVAMAPAWFMGVWAADWRGTGARRMDGAKVLLLYAAFLAARQLPHFPGRNLIIQLGWCAVCAAAVVWLNDVQPARSRLAAVVEPLRRLGLASYSLYAFHTPVIILVGLAVEHGCPPLPYLIALVAITGLSVGGALLGYGQLERRWRYRPKT